MDITELFTLILNGEFYCPRCHTQMTNSETHNDRVIAGLCPKCDWVFL